MTGAIVHEWIEAAGGAEKVLDAMVDEFPDADVFALWNDDPARYPGRRPTETILARTPLRRHKALALAAMPFIWRSLHPYSDYEWMLVSSHLFAHHAAFRGARGRMPKIVYTHSPARYIWNPEADPRGRGRAVRAVAPAFRALDRKRAQEPDAFIANSAFVADRIRAAWGRDATVIHPPVDVQTIQSRSDWSTALEPAEQRIAEALPPQFLLGASRFVGYKRLGMVIAAGAELGIPVVIAGRGPGEDALRRLAAAASVTVTFVIAPSDELLFTLYQRALAFVFPAIEDFGIMPVEAMALGCPVVVYHVGGQSESVREGSGHVVTAMTPYAWAQGIRRAIGTRDAAAASAAAAQFDTSRFRGELHQFLTGQLPVTPLPRAQAHGPRWLGRVA